MAHVTKGAMMTWNEFKEHVDKILESKGSKGDIEIWYIDISYPTKNTSVDIVTTSDDPQLKVSN